jgi:hypothetical protein
MGIVIIGIEAKSVLDDPTRDFGDRVGLFDRDYTSSQRVRKLVSGQGETPPPKNAPYPVLDWTKDSGVAPQIPL